MTSPSLLTDIRPGETRLQAKRRKLAEKRKVFERGMATAQGGNTGGGSPNWKKKLLAESSPAPSMAMTATDSTSASPSENATMLSSPPSNIKMLADDDTIGSSSAAPPPPPTEPLSPIYFAFETNHKLSLQQRRQQLAERRRKFETRMMNVSQENNRSSSSGLGIISPPSVQRKSVTKPEAPSPTESGSSPASSPSPLQDASVAVTTPTTKDIQPTNLFPSASTTTATIAPTKTAQEEKATAANATRSGGVAVQRQVFEGETSNTISSSSVDRANNSNVSLEPTPPTVTTSSTPTKKGQWKSKLQQPRATPPGKTISLQQVTPVSAKKQAPTNQTPDNTASSELQSHSQQKGSPTKSGWKNRFGWTSPGKKKNESKSPEKISAKKQPSAVASVTSPSNAKEALPTTSGLAKDPWEQFGEEQKQSSPRQRSPRLIKKTLGSFIPLFRSSKSSATAASPPTKKEVVKLKPVNQQTPHKHQLSTPGSSARKSRIPEPKVLYSNPKVVVPPPGPFRPPEKEKPSPTNGEGPTTPPKEDSHGTTEPVAAAAAAEPDTESSTAATNSALMSTEKEPEVTKTLTQLNTNDESKTNVVVAMEEKFAQLQQQNSEVVISSAAEHETPLQRKRRLLAEQRRNFETRMDQAKARTSSPPATPSGAPETGGNSDVVVADEDVSPSNSTISTKDTMEYEDDLEDMEVPEASQPVPHSPQHEGTEKEPQQHQGEKQQETPPVELSSSSTSFASNTSKPESGGSDFQARLAQIRTSFASNTSKPVSGSASTDFEARLAQIRSTLSPPAGTKKKVQPGPQLPSQQDMLHSNRQAHVDQTPTEATTSVEETETPLQAKRRQLAEQRRAFETRMAQAKKSVIAETTSIDSAGPAAATGSATLAELPAKEPDQDRGISMAGTVPISSSSSSSADEKAEQQQLLDSHQEDQQPNNSFEATLQNVRSALSPTGQIRKTVASVPKGSGIELPLNAEDLVEKAQSISIRDESPLQRKRRELAEQRKAFESKMEQAKASNASFVTTKNIPVVVSKTSNETEVDDADQSTSAEEAAVVKAGDSEGGERELHETDSPRKEEIEPVQSSLSDEPVFDRIEPNAESELEETPLQRKRRELAEQKDLLTESGDAKASLSGLSALADQAELEAEPMTEETPLQRKRRELAEQKDLLSESGHVQASSSGESALAEQTELEAEPMTKEAPLEETPLQRKRRELAEQKYQSTPEESDHVVKGSISEELASGEEKQPEAELVSMETPLQRKRRELAEQRKAFETKMEEAKSLVVSSAGTKNPEIQAEDAVSSNEESVDSTPEGVVVFEPSNETAEISDTEVVSVAADDDDKVPAVEQPEIQSDEEKDEEIRIETPLERKRRELAERKRALEERRQAKIREQEEIEEEERRRAEEQAKKEEEEAEVRRAEAARLASLPRPPPPRPASHFGFTIQRQDEQNDDDGFSWNAWKDSNDALYHEDEIDTGNDEDEVPGTKIATVDTEVAMESIPEASPTVSVLPKPSDPSAEQHEERKDEYVDETPLQRKRRLLAEQRLNFETKMDQAKARSMPSVEAVLSEPSTPAMSDDVSFETKVNVIAMDPSLPSNDGLLQDRREEESAASSTDQKVQEDRDTDFDKREVSELVQEVHGLASSLRKYEVELEDACRSLVDQVAGGELKEGSEEELWATGAPKSDFLDMYGKIVQQPWYRAHVKDGFEDGIPADADAASFAIDRQRGYKVTTLGQSFLENDGPAEADITIFLHSFTDGSASSDMATSSGFIAMTLPSLEERWTNVARVAKTAQSKRICDKLEDLLSFCLRANFVE